jgi:D-glycero-alpha-D-manno-heptose-7-phosphate kinase
MRIIKAPLRVSLFGGGCDLPEYSDKHGATIISFAIDRYMHVTWNPRPTGGCRLTYGKVEELDTFADAEHTLVRACARRYGIPEPATLSIVSDVPKGTGLGSSSALAVALCELVGATRTSGLDLATTAYQLEREVAPVGWQDHQPAAWGGMRVYRTAEQGIASLPVTRSVRNIAESGLLLYTNRERDSAPILRTWAEKVESLHEIRELAEHVAKMIESPVSEFLNLMPIKHWGDRLQSTWLRKRRIPGVSDVTLDAQYSTAIHTGALGGKLLGAGGGGCWYFIVPDDRRQAVKDALGLVEIPFRIPNVGVTEYEV